jgi:Hydrazine synthase alpha subunit middle domain
LAQILLYQSDKQLAPCRLSQEKPMARTVAPHSSLGISALIGALAVLSGCGSSDKPGDGSGVQVEGVSQIVYAVRQHTVLKDGKVERIDVAGGMGQVMDYQRFVPGGRLELRDLATGQVDNIIEGYETADVSSVDLSFDATKVLFTMKKDDADKYHVYWAGLTRGEDGKFPIEQLTSGPYDDQQAIWVAGDRIVFTTNQAYTEMGTRADEYNHSRAVTQLASITLAGGDADRKLCSQNLSHTITLFSMQDGRVGFSRWEHLENVNDVKLMAMNPDCTQMIGLNGQFGKPGNSLVQFTESETPYVFYGIVTNRENTIQAGSLVKLDARFVEDPTKLDMEKTSDEAYEMLTPAVPTGDEASTVGRYRSPAVLPDGRLLVTWADNEVNELNELSFTPPDYGVYVYNTAKRQNQLVVNYDKSWELYAKPVAKRITPQPISSRQNVTDASVPTLFGSIDVRQSSLYKRHKNTVGGAQFEDGTSLDEALKGTVKVRIIEGFSSEGSPGTTMFGLTMAEGAALIGEAKVEADGSWLANVPPYIPMHLQAVDEFELAIRNETTWIQGMPGEDRVCGGCHEDRTQPSLPGGQAITIAAGRGAEDFMVPVLERTEYPWARAKDPSNPNQLQTLFDQKCVSCHNEETNGDKPQEFYQLSGMNAATGEPYESVPIPRLDLSSRPITVTYDRSTDEWPASYVSIFYPAALEMEMERVDMVTGTIPPKWGVPSDARHSALIEKLNITSELDSSKYAWALGEQFSLGAIAGGTRTDHASEAKLTREEVRMLIRAIDMGGQFFARQNSEFTLEANNPVAGTEY